MLTRFKHITSKVAAFMTILIVFLIIIVWSCVSIYIYRLFTDQILKDNTAIVEKINIQINNDLDSIQDYAKNIIYSDEIQTLMRKYYTVNGFEKFSISNDIKLKLSKYSLLKSNIIHEMYIIDSKNGDQVAMTETYGYIFDQQWYKEIINKEELEIYSCAYSVIREAGIPINIISFIIQINDIKNPEEVLGSLIINIDYEAIFSKLNSEDKNNKKYYIVDNNSNILFSNLDFKKDKSFDYISHYDNPIITTDDYNYITLPIEKLNYLLIMELPKAEIKNNFNPIFKVIFIFFILSLLIGIILVIPLSKSLTKPIIALSDGMNNVAKGNFDHTIEIDDKSELKEMANSFNNMTSKITQLLEDIEKSYRKEKEMQIKLFMSKINPHFIYNTLYSIISLSTREGSQEITDLTKAFINILRRNIVINERKILIKDEIQYLNNYIYILKYQYGDKISISYDVDDEVLEYKLRPMILYPIVENSIFHGIAPKDERGEVKVKISKNNTKINISISDDGVGIEKSKLIYMNQYLNTCHEDGHIGLKSVYDRLRFFYGDDIDFKIESELSKGTNVVFTIDIDRLG